MRASRLPWRFSLAAAIRLSTSARGEVFPGPQIGIRGPARSNCSIYSCWRYQAGASLLP